MPATLARPLARRLSALTPAAPSRSDDPALPPAVAAAAVQALADGHTHYADRPGILPLRQWVCADLERRCGLRLAPEDVTITCGRSEARYIILRELAQQAPVYCPDADDTLRTTAQLVGASVVTEPAAPEAIRLALLDASAGRALLEQAVALAEAHGWWLVWDATPIATGASLPHPALQPGLAGRVITTGSLSPWLPGWRIGWMAGSTAAGRLLLRKLELTICSTSISQWAALGLVPTL